MDALEVALFVFLAVLGVAGGVPHLLQWMARRPHLEIVEAAFKRGSAENFRYDVHLVVENQRLWWRKSGDASNVVAEYYLIDRDGVQRGFVSGQLVTPFLLAGTRAMKDIESYHSLAPESGHYLVVFRVTCAEGVVAKRLFSCDFSS